MKLLLLFIISFPLFAEQFNLIKLVKNAPVVSNGLTEHEPTELNIILNIKDYPSDLAMNPDIKGYIIPLQGEMIISFLKGFERNGFDNTKKFVNVNSNGNLVFVNGHPQNPIVSTSGEGTQHGDYQIIDDGRYTFRIKRNGRISERENKVGIKTIHLRPNPKVGDGSSVFTNKGILDVAQIAVSIINSKGETIHSGIKSFRFLKGDQPQIHITNMGLTTLNQGSYESRAELIESINFQSVKTGTYLLEKKRVEPFSAGAPYAPRFLIFEASSKQPNSFIPQLGHQSLSFVKLNNKIVAVYEGNTYIGEITLYDPQKDDLSNDSKILINEIEVVYSGDGVTGQNGTLIICPIKVGQKRGMYQLSFKLKSGNTANLYTKVLD